MTPLAVIVVTNAMKSKSVKCFRGVTRATSQISKSFVALEIQGVWLASGTDRLRRCVAVLELEPLDEIPQGLKPTFILCHLRHD